MEEKTKSLLTSIEKWFKIILWIIGILAVLAIVFLFFSSSSVNLSPQ
jgi:hypothetical protein